MDDCLRALLQGRLLALVDAGLLLGLGRPGAHPVHPAAAAQGGRVGDHRRLLHGRLPLRGCCCLELQAGRVHTIPRNRSQEMVLESILTYWSNMSDLSPVGLGPSSKT